MRLTSGMLCEIACDHRILIIGVRAIINRVFASAVLCLRVQRGNLRGGGGLGGKSGDGGVTMG